jgi:AcrR family transcriptional regulator
VAYRRTEKVVRRLAKRHAAITAAARALAAEGGMGAVQIAPVAARAGIASGTVYRYFPSKAALVAAVVRAVSDSELAAMRNAADAAPGPLSALAAAIATFAGRALHERRLAWAVIAEPVDADAYAVRLAYRKALVLEIDARMRAAAAHLADADPALAAPALVGGLLEGLIGPLAADFGTAPSRQWQAVQHLTLLSLRALGVPDARARGLVVQTHLPAS